MNTKAQDIKKQLAKCARELAGEGLVAAVSGNISARCASAIYIKKSGTSFKNAKPRDFVDIKKIKQVSIEWKLHSACYKARPDIKAVVHTHPVAILALAAMGEKLNPVTIDCVIYFKSGIRQVGFAQPGSKKLAAIAACAAKKHNGIILKNHGLVTVGASLKEAGLRAIMAEREAKIILASRLLKRRTKYLTRKQIALIYNI
ncbi:MAG: class II aldolase/adducin family protein [Candidatus Omnitrophota bacterium]